MARAGILYSQVSRAATQLAESGRTPTIDTVREALGDTGSKSTIAPMLKRWKTEHQDVVSNADSGLPMELVEAVKSIYERLQADVALQLKKMGVVHDQALEAMRCQRDAALAEHAQLRQDHEALTREWKQSQQRLSKSLEELQGKALALTAAHTEITGLQQRLADRGAEASALNQQVTQARVQFEHFQEAAAHQRTEERQSFEQRIARLEQEIIAGQRRQEALQATYSQREATLAHQAVELERLHPALAQAQDELGRVRSERDQQTAQLQNLASARADAERRLDMAQQALIEAKTGAAAAGKQVEMLTSQLVTAERKADQAERDKAAWIDKILAGMNSTARYGA